MHVDSNITLALLFEYKADGRPGLSGPGDALRLAHALRHPDFLDVRLVLASTVPESRLRGLFAYEHFLPVDCTSETEVGDVPDGDLRSLVGDLIAQVGAAAAVHAFVGHERKPAWKPVTYESVGGHAFSRQRIDSSRFMRHARWSKSVQHGVVDARADRVAVFLRTLVTDRDRNTPQWFPNLVREVLAPADAQILWCGSVRQFKGAHGEFELRTGEEHFDPGDLPFHDQSAELAKRAGCAVGWNSGGLDLAATAGVPVLRVGEFQHTKSLEDEPDEVRRSHQWRDDYNSFLAVATNVGLQPRALAPALFSQPVLRESLGAFIANLGVLQAPIHAILPAGETLQADRSKLLEQLLAYAVR